MAWTESHDTLADHPKILNLMRLLNINRREALGTVKLLWDFTLHNAWRTGDLSSWSEDHIAKKCDWDGDPHVFCEALRTCGDGYSEHGFLDGNKVHDWFDYCGDLIQKRLQYMRLHKKRVKRISPRNLRELGEKSPRIGGESVAVSHPTLPNHTIPNHTNKKDNKKDIVPQFTHFCQDIIDDLNNIIETKYTVTSKVKELIQARKNEGHGFEDFQKVHRHQASRWKNDPQMRPYLRPLTLYSNKFDGYLNCPPDAGITSSVVQKNIETTKDWLKEEGTECRQKKHLLKE